MVTNELDLFEDMNTRSRIQLALFAHNEGENVVNVIRDIDSQVLLEDQNIDVSILCNGCIDRTSALARDSVEKTANPRLNYKVYEWQEGGKSKTWNRFADGIRHMQAVEIVVFMDSDIRIRDSECLQRLIVECLADDVVAVTSCPRATFPSGTSWLVKRVLSATARKHTDGPICGQLYAVKRQALDNISLPVPCLVEDGFLAACLNTRLFQTPATPAIRNRPLVRASRTASHEFSMTSSLDELFRHSVRLALGTEMNAALYTALWQAASSQERASRIREFACGEGIEFWFAQRDSSNLTTLSFSRTCKQFTKEIVRSGIRGVFKTPLVLVKAIFMIFVNREANHLFRTRTFKW